MNMIIARILTRFGSRCVWFAAVWLGLAAPADAASGKTAATAANWPQWRGPLANGVAPDGNPPTVWSETQNVKWKTKLPGGGAGTPIIWGNQVFVQVAIPTGKKGQPGPEKKAAALLQPSVFGQAQPAAPPPPPGEAPPGDGQRQRRPGGPGPPGGPGGLGGGEKPTETYQFVILAVDRATGKTQWQKIVREEVPHEGHHKDHGFASHSPITDGEHVFSWFGSHGLYCLDLKGELKWEKDFGDLRTIMGFGEGSAPALSGDTLVVNWDHEGDDFIVALDKTTGKERWRQPRDEHTTWSTPLIVQYEGKAQVVVCASQRIRSYDLATGQQLWECGGMTANVIPSPVSDFGMVYAISGFRGNALLAIKLGRSGDLTDSDAIAWKYARSTPYVPSPLLYGDKLYFLAGNNPIFSCFEAKTGKPVFEAERLSGPSGFYASPVGAGGRIYLAGRNGTSLVLKQSDKLEVLATNKLDEQFEASPAVVGQDLFLRGHKSLYCLAEK
ncbi:MAG TPA: PQQ-binding-like beta-propeller repeat protein [Verrucomicrobiae bacterium]|nr:PQQ-binding-like beta-propeller repeat protein [Verrucomicrobiae bacterium]